MAEVILGIWLLSGLRPKVSQLLACLCFMGFLTVALNKALAGHSSCGCFGALTVNPWLTAGFDAAVVIALSSAMRPVGVRRLWSAGATLLVAASLGAALHLSSSGGEERGYPIDPRQWLGGRMALPEDVWAGRGIDDSDWFVAFYTPGCASCHAEFDRLFAAVAERRSKGEAVSVAVIEVPAGQRVPSHEYGRAEARGRLASGVPFLAQTPLILEVRGGVVVGHSHSAELVSH